MKIKVLTVEEEAAAAAEAEAFAAGVFSRMAERRGPGARGQVSGGERRRSRVTRHTPPVTKQDWFSGVEAAVPNGDRD